MNLLDLIIDFEDLKWTCAVKSAFDFRGPTWSLELQRIRRRHSSLSTLRALKMQLLTRHNKRGFTTTSTKSNPFG